jgi:hypothetical protein
MTGEGDCGAIGGMKIGRGNRSTRRKPAPPQIPLDQTRNRTRAAAVGSQRLTAWARRDPSAAVSIVCVGCGELLLVFTSTFILGSVCLCLHDHILLSQTETAWVVSGKFLVVLASIVILSLSSRRDLWPRFLFCPWHVRVLEVEPPLRWRDRSCSVG